MAKKPHGVTMLHDEYKPKSTMQLEDKHANTVKSHKIGEKVQMVVSGTKTHHSMNSDGTHSAAYHVHSVKMMDKDEVSGPNKKGSENDEKGSESHQ